MFSYFDSHCDTITSVSDSNPLRSNRLHVDLTRGSKIGHYVQCYAVFTDLGASYLRRGIPQEDFKAMALKETLLASDRTYAHYRSYVDLFYRETAANADLVRVCKTAADLDAAREAGICGAILTVEDAGQLTSPETAWEDGVRMVTLTWNYRNILGGSCVTGGGLTDYGRDFVQRCAKCGIICDLSHGSEELFWDVARTIDKPFVASHSNAKALCSHPRNLTDDQFRELIARGGVTGINLYGKFITESGDCTLEDVCRHIDHFMELGGEKNVGIGGDLDGCSIFPKEFHGVEDIGKLRDALKQRGYSDALLDDLFYWNLYRVFQEVVGSCNT